MVELTQQQEGVVLAVRVQPRARRNQILGEQAGALKVAVTEPPEKGKANRAVVELLCRTLGLRRQQLQLLSGARSRTKRFLAVGLDPSQLAIRLQQCLYDAGQNDSR